MKSAHINDPFRNPFRNRFHVPVHSRLDEMQAYTQMVWLHDPVALDHQPEKNDGARLWRRALAGAFAVLFVVFSAALLT